MERVPHLHGIVKKLLPPLLLLLGLVTFTTAQIGCIGDDGSEVEWYIIYKLPKITKVGKTQVVDERVDGYHYLYTDNTIISTDKKLRLSKHSLKETDIILDRSAVQHTLEQIYRKKRVIKKNQAELIYVMYNDQFPGHQISRAIYGHAKGVTAFGSQTGFWMVHSVPNFPNSLLGGYKWPGNALDNGQVMLCISLTTSNLQQVSANMVLRQVYAYETHVQESVLNDFRSQPKNRQKWPEWKASVEAALEEIGKKGSKRKLITQKYPHGTATPYLVSIRTYNPQEKELKQRVDFLAKTSAYGVNFYSWLAKFYQIYRVPNKSDGMRVQTWRRGSGGPLPSYCPDVSYGSVSLMSTCMVQNVKLITAADTLNQSNSQLRSHNGAYTVPFKWSYTKDHSKWGIGISSEPDLKLPTGIVCIGDLNRVLSQGDRAGGAICIPNQDLYDAFDKLIPDTKFYEQCPKINDTQQKRKFVFPTLSSTQQKRKRHRAH